MKKWRETKDLEEVAEALDAGLVVEHGGRRVVRTLGVILSLAGSDDYLPTAPGRVFRIEEKAKEFAGPTVGVTRGANTVAKANAEKFLADHPEPKERRLERVKLFRNNIGALCYSLNSWTYSHIHAVSEKGFEHYIYENGSISVLPVLRVDSENLFPIAFERWVEEGE